MNNFYNNEVTALVKQLSVNLEGLETKTESYKHALAFVLELCVQNGDLITHLPRL